MTAFGYRYVCPTPEEPLRCHSDDQEVVGRVVSAAGADVGKGVPGLTVHINWGAFSTTVQTDADGRFSLHIWNGDYSMPWPIMVTIFGMRPPLWIAYTEGDGKYLPSAAAGPFAPSPR